MTSYGITKSLRVTYKPAAALAQLSSNRFAPTITESSIGRSQLYVKKTHMLHQKLTNSSAERRAPDLISLFPSCPGVSK
jgi:hypothetical protein